MSYLSSTPWPKHPLVYEINTRVWLTELSAKLGRRITLDKVPADEIERIARLGFHAVWLMGVWTTGPEPVEIARNLPNLVAEYKQVLPDYTAEDCLGSPYAISEYAVSPRLGGTAALAVFRDKLARAGLRLMLDFVCGHLARDHELLNTRPEAFVQGNEADLAKDPSSFFRSKNGHIIAHGRDPHFPAWTDTAQVNYGQAPGREIMRETLLAIANRCDGARCDMAMLILPDVMEKMWGPRLGANPVTASFWKDIIAEVLASHPNFIFLGESYWNLEWRLQQEGFHFTYDKTLYDRLRASDLRGVRQHLRADMAFQNRCARFVENHDEQRAATAFGPARARSAAAATFFCTGLKLIHEGHLEGRRARVPVQLGRRPLEKEDVETALFYEKILGTLRDPLFQEGIFTLRDVNSPGWKDTSNESLLAISWSPNGNSKRACLGYLIVINMSGSHAYGRVLLPDSVFQAGKQYLFHDQLNGKRYERDGGELVSPGLYIALEEYQSHVFEVSAKASS
jgi:hypothetical protein